MKTKIQQFVLPMLVVVFAITTAFNTNASSSKKTAALVNGYIQHIGEEEPCEESTECSTIVSTFCRVGQVAANPRLWDKNTNGECVVPLYKPAP